MVGEATGGPAKGVTNGKVATLLLLALGVAVYLMFGIGEVVEGNLNSVQHLLPAVALALVIARRPKAGDASPFFVGS